MEEKYWLLIIGVAIGWLIKSPFVIKYYRYLKKEREHMETIVSNFEKMNIQ